MCTFQYFHNPRQQMPGKAKRTTHRSSSGKKLYAERSAKGKFKDIQSYERAHGQDVKRKSKKEGSARKTARSKKKYAGPL